jgi:hypothetical protein
MDTLEGEFIARMRPTEGNLREQTAEKTPVLMPQRLSLMKGAVVKQIQRKKQRA